MRYIDYDKYIQLVTGIVKLQRTFRNYAAEHGDFELADNLDKTMDQFLLDSKETDPERYDEILEASER